MSRSTPADGEDRADALSRSAAAVYRLLSSLILQVPRELSPTSSATLAALNGGGPHRITDLARIAGVTQPSVTALVTTLERSGFVERRSDPADRRVVLVAITPAGSEYLLARRRRNVEAFARVIAELPPDEAAALHAAAPALEHLSELTDDLRNASRSPDGSGRKADV
ncbi:MarR family winged helix-turn-helix transcriptional regulator [Streptomyces sp. NPDC059582]|uniref:MarR family winged helix-turn-helix transcriptional regulator n=1 Tax=Streptomyces sp. NPDC059582 TaxID=3346875 RepID=UPI00369BCD3D